MRVAIYAGTFDPITRGHLSVLERVSGLFDRLVVLVAVNPAKSPLFSELERVELIAEATAALPGVCVASTSEWVAAYARRVGAQWLIRGVRDTTDITSEHQLACLNQQIAPELTTLFVPAEAQLASVSSTRLKQLARAGEPLDAWCAPGVARALRRKLRAGARGDVEVGDDV